MFVASMNPCKCGYFGSDKKKCKCSQKDIKRYLSKISGPLLDRIDIQINIKEVKIEKIKSNCREESSEEIRKRVNKVRNIQKERYKDYGIKTNSELNNSLIKKFCILDDKSDEIIEKAFNRLNLSARAYLKIIKVARTIADLDGRKNIMYTDVAEAIGYRDLDRR